jgi:hypothetical protein
LKEKFEMTDRDEARRLFEAVFDHLEREGDANSDEARAAAQRAALSVINDCIERAGWTDLLRRRAVAFVHGRAEGSQSRADDLEGLLDGNTHNIRRAIARTQHDLRILPRKESNAAIWSLILAEGGRAGVHGDGGMWAHDPASGVHPDTGATHTLKVHIVDMIGYTSGAMGFPDTRALQELLLVRAVKYWGRKSRASKQQKVKPVTKETIRDWCKPSGEFAPIFDSSRQRGSADKAAKRIDRAKMLPD